MSRPGFPVPPLLLTLDVFGALLIALGVLALTGNDFGHPVLVTAAPGLIALGAALMVPIVVWAVRRKSRGGP
jgi:hypothetical protein